MNCCFDWIPPFGAWELSADLPSVDGVDDADVDDIIVAVAWEHILHREAA
jgi:hypothetical protein